MNNSPHISLDRIADLIQGRVTTDEQALALSHIAECERCSNLKHRLSALVELAQDDKSEDAPEYAISRAVGLLRARTAQSPSRLKRFIATLSFDSLNLAPAFGMRAGESLERQLVFSAGENKVQLQISPTGEEWAVFGQVLGGCPSGDVEARGVSGAATAKIESGEFVLPRLPSGEYTLVVRLSVGEVEIPGLKLGTKK
jgi:hypothetical protein